VRYGGVQLGDTHFFKRNCGISWVPLTIVLVMSGPLPLRLCWVLLARLDMGCRPSSVRGAIEHPTLLTAVPQAYCSQATIPTCPAFSNSIRTSSSPQNGLAAFLLSPLPVTGSLNSFQLTGYISLPSSLLAMTTPNSFRSVAT
jgi:hypothetical protein